MSDDDDDEQAGPTKFEFSAESKLDEDHVFFLQFTNNFISNVTRPRDFDHCTRWLERLAGEPMYGVNAKRNRNMYLARLLIAMMDNKVVGPFSTFPPPGPLPSAAEAFGLVPDEEKEDQADLALDWPDRELNMSEYKFKSNDGRTYVSTCALPNGNGAMGFVGITIGGGEGLWINKEGERVSLADFMGGDTISAITTKTPLKEQIEMVTSYKFRSKFEIDEPPPFKYLIRLPESVLSSSNLVEVKTRPCSPANCKLLREEYPEELVEMLEKLLHKSKAETDRKLRSRHTKVVQQLYKEFELEVERGLNDFKLARMEWQEVMDVVDALHEIDDELEKRDSEVGGSSDDVLKILSESYNQANKRAKVVYKEGLELDKKIEESHKVIHDRAIIHKHELGILEKHIEKLCSDINKLKVESRRKHQVIQALLSEIKEKK